MSEKDQFYFNKHEPIRACLLALRTLILSKDPDISETQKYGMPCFCYGRKAFCYLWTDKKTTEPYLLFVDGNLLDHPALETGDRKRMKIFRIDPKADLPLLLIDKLLKAALDVLKD